jgi:hypothetical protein
MAGTECFFQYCEGSLVECLGLGVSALPVVEYRELRPAAVTQKLLFVLTIFTCVRRLPRRLYPCHDVAAWSFD